MAAARTAGAIGVIARHPAVQLDIVLPPFAPWSAQPPCTAFTDSAAGEAMAAEKEPHAIARIAAATSPSQVRRKTAMAHDTPFRSRRPNEEASSEIGADAEDEAGRSGFVAGLPGELRGSAEQAGWGGSAKRGGGVRGAGGA